jgi:hypothetical protein
LGFQIRCVGFLGLWLIGFAAAAQEVEAGLVRLARQTEYFDLQNSVAPAAPSPDLRKRAKKHSGDLTLAKQVSTTR